MSSKLQPTWHDRYDEYGWCGEFIGYAAVDAPAQDLMVARNLVAETTRGAPATLVKAELARLRLVTKARNETSDDLKAMFAVYAEYLSDYPPDVVAHACRWWARNEKFWPAWAELKEHLDRAMRKRKAIGKAVGLRI